MRRIDQAARTTADAVSLTRKVSSEDSRKLNEFLTSVREVEKRVDRMRRDQTRADENARARGKPLLAMNRPDLNLSNVWSGSRHDKTQLPVLTVGGLGGMLKTGRVLDYPEAGDQNRKSCSLHLSLMDRMGVSLPRFGDADTRLAEL